MGIIQPISAMELQAMDNKQVHEDRTMWIDYHVQLIIEQVLWRARRGLTSMIFPTTLLKDKDAVYFKKGSFKGDDHTVLMDILREKFPDCQIKFERYDDPDANESSIDIDIRW